MGFISPTPTTSPADSPISKPQAFRFLNQATFGATEAEAERLIALGNSATAYSRWIDEQMELPPSTQLAYVQAARPIPPPPGFDYSRLNFQRRDIWFQNSVRGSDQLRQRVAWALSQILVTSQVSLANRYPFGLADYYDMLARHAFGDFRQLIEEVTLHPMMGVYLSMLGNRKPNAELNIRPDENYARELMQLFTIGLVELNADGTPKLDAHNQPIPTYDQAVVEGFAHVFTGWHWACTFGSPANCGFSNTRGTVPNQILPMQLFPEEHDTGAKRLLTYPNAVKSVIPAGQTAEQDLADALDNIFHHPNVGPFISRQLIQRLVDEQSVACVRRARERSVRRRRHRAARQSGGGRARDPSRRGGTCACEHRGPRRQQAQGAGAPAHAALARLRRQSRERPVLQHRPRRGLRAGAAAGALRVQLL